MTRRTVISMADLQAPPPPSSPPLASTQGKGNGRQTAASGMPVAAPIVATPFVWRPSSQIPPRQWLYGRHLIRGFLSCTVAPGGIGKSALTITEALAMVTGRPLLGQTPAGRLRVWLWNGEDPTEEIERRLAAAAQYFGINPEDCGDRLFVDSGRATPIILAEAGKDGVTINAPAFNALKSQIIQNRIDVMSIDPFVSSHRLTENDNMAIDRVAKAWAQLGEETGCAFDLTHHTRKTGGAEVTVEDSRGASALINACRSARALNRMTREEASGLGIVDNERLRYFRIDPSGGKTNLAPPASKAEWFKLESVGIGNGREDDPEASQDFVGVVTSWTAPNPLDGITVADLLAVQRAIDGKQFRESVQARDWVGYEVANVLKLDPDRAAGRIKALLKRWLKSGALARDVVLDDKSRERPIIRVGNWADETSGSTVPPTLKSGVEKAGKVET